MSAPAESNTGPEITVTIFDDVAAASLKTYQWTIDELAERVRDGKTYPNKEACPLLKLATFGDQRTDKKSLRHDANVLEIFGIEGDYDGEVVSPADAQVLLYEQNISAIIYTSPSHNEAKPRWRVLAPLSHAYPPSERARLVARLNGALGGVLAPESFRLSQSFYCGRVNGAPYAVAQVRGQCIDELADLAEIYPPEKGESKAERVKILRSTDPVIAKLAERNLLLRNRSEGGADIVCPFEAEHTTPRAPADCSYFPPHTGGFKRAHFKCLHSHCAGRSDGDFLRALGFENAPPPEKTVPAFLVKCSPLDWAALAARGEPPPRRWALYGWLGFFINLMVGSGGIGKTLLAQQMGSAMALGRTFIDEIEHAITVLAWFCEDEHDEIWRRQVKIATHFGIGIEAFRDKFIIMARHGMENALVTTEFGRPMFTPLIGELREQAADYRADVVMLDNAAQLYGGGENDRHAVTFFMNGLAGALPGRAVLLLAHPARSQGSEFSGSGAWENVARNRLFLGSRLPDQQPDADEQPDDDVRYLARRKANYTSKDWRRFQYQNGVLVPDAVEPTCGLIGHLYDQAAERAILDGLKRLQAMGIHPSEGATTSRYLPRLLLEYKLAEGRSKAELAGAMRRLMVDGRLAKAVVGKYAGNRSPMYGLTASE